MAERVDELLSEYQDYVMADRLRRALGGPLTPEGPTLTLARYAARRLRRQDLARALVRKEVPLAALGEIERLTEALCFGFWHNPQEVAGFLRRAIRLGGHPLLGSPEALAGLLTEGERRRLTPAGVRRVAGHYHACLSLAAPTHSPESFERLYARLEASRPPLFLDGLSAVQEA